MSTPVTVLDLDEITRDDDAGFGALGTTRGNLPLHQLDVRTAITGLTARTELTQGFQNPFDEPLEATYVFPLPSRGAVTALRMEADGRVVEGELKERAEARATYDQAIDAGQRASIAEEERPGVFTMRVGNILPGERVTIRLTVVGPLPYADGEAEFRFPLVVAPRYHPGTPLPGEQVGDGTAPDTDAVPDASRISPPVLLPGFPNPVRLSTEVTIDPAGLVLTGVRSSLHVTTTDGDGLTVRMQPGERADRDFVLRLALGAADSLTTSVAVLPDAEGQDGTFALTVLPPTKAVVARPRDVVIVLDRSGSMSGWKMVAARRAAARIVDTLTSTDRFTTLAFDNTVEYPPALGADLVEATDRNRFRAVEHLASVEARGGTEMVAPLLRAAELLANESPRDRVLVLVTDGQVGGEDQLMQALSPKLADVRVHTVGIDRAVNEGFLRRLAGVGLGGGRCELVESEDRLDEAAQNIHHRIASPLVTGLAVHADGIDTGTLAPARLPDLFVGAPAVITGRYRGTAPTAITVTGQHPDGTAWRADVTATTSANPALAAVWARARVRDLEDRYAAGATQHEQEIVATSLRFGVLCRFTAFVAVDSRVVTDGGQSRRVTQPVDLPQGWDIAAPASFAAQPAPMAMQMRGAAQRPGGVAPRSAPRTSGAQGMKADGGYDRGFRTAKLADQPVAAGPPPAPQPTGGPAAPVAAGRPASAAEPAEERVHRAQDQTAFATEQLALLRAASDRATALRELATRIRAWLATSSSDELRDLAALLERPVADDTEMGRRWQHTVDALEALTGTRSRRFWRR